MSTKFSKTVEFFFSSETILPFLIGSVFLAVLGNGVYQILTNWLGVTTPNLLKIIGLALLIFLFCVFLLWRRLSRIPVLPPMPNKKTPKKHKGLILLVSRIEPCRKAIQYHQPVLELCWLICSAKTLGTANELQQEFSATCCAEPIVINDVHDPLEYRDRVDEIYREKLPQGWNEGDVVSDYLGMTANGSVGMVLACVGSLRPLQYTPAVYNEELKAHIPLDPIEIVLN